jgi:transcriptional regulator GlxA family with amidase domain
MVSNTNAPARIPPSTVPTSLSASCRATLLLACALAALLAAPPAGATPDLPADRPLVVAFLAVDGVYNTELMAPYDVFHHTVFHTAPQPGMEVYVVSPDGEPVTTFEGIVIHPHHGFADAPQPDVLVVPSAEGSMSTDLDDAELISWVRRTGGKARWVVSLCDGAFVLAKAGLLDGRAATTFPADYDELVDLFPQVDLRVNVSFVHDGKVLTSEGGARSYDVAMYLVDLLYGTKVAQGVGAGLLIPWPPQRGETMRYTVIPTAPATATPPGPAPAGSGRSAASGP